MELVDTKDKAHSLHGIDIQYMAYEVMGDIDPQCESWQWMLVQRLLGPGRRPSTEDVKDIIINRGGVREALLRDGVVNPPLRLVPGLGYADVTAVTLAITARFWSKKATEKLAKIAADRATVARARVAPAMPAAKRPPMPGGVGGGGNTRGAGMAGKRQRMR
jgi:hypothetical protein